MDYLENYLQRNNHQISNILDNLEGTNIKSITTDLLKDIIHISDRLKRLSFLQGQSEKSCTILVKLLQFEDREGY